MISMFCHTNWHKSGENDYKNCWFMNLFDARFFSQRVFQGKDILLLKQKNSIPLLAPQSVLLYGNLSSWKSFESPYPLEIIIPVQSISALQIY
jgi:hypothetical protein